MRSTVLAFAASLALAASASAADPAPATGAKPAEQKATDGETMAFLCALNQHEIVAANVAEQKKVTGGALEYARMLQKEHGQNLVDTFMLSSKSKMPPAPTPAIEAMKKKHEAELADLAAKDGDAFQKGFVEAMVKGHTEALAQIDQRVAAAQNADLKKHLTATRGHIAMHLDQAKKLQTSSTTNASASTPK